MHGNYATILDKLIVGDEAIEAQWSVKDRELYGLIRDIYNILNSTCYPMKMSNGFELVEQSIVNLGLGNLAGTMVNSGHDVETMRRYITEQLEMFEPRIKNVNVKTLSNDAPTLSIQYELHAELNMNNDFNSLQLIVALDTVTNRLMLSGIDYG